MTNIAAYGLRLVVLGVAACGCGSSTSTTGGAASCGGTAACGGTVDGTWQLDSVCTEGDLPAALESTLNFPTACAGAVNSATMTATGTVVFAGGTQTDNITTTLQGTAVVSPACVAAELGATITLSDTVCALVQTQISGTTGVTSATCSFASGNCNCSVTIVSSSDTTPKTYTISGTSITYTNGDAPTDYCVSGTTLTARQLRVDFGNIYLDSTLHKI